MTTKNETEIRIELKSFLDSFEGKDKTSDYYDRIKCFHQEIKDSQVRPVGLLSTTSPLHTGARGFDDGE